MREMNAPDISHRLVSGLHDRIVVMNSIIVGGSIHARVGGKKRDVNLGQHVAHQFLRIVLMLAACQTMRQNYLGPRRKKCEGC
jgi:hypothetical protein